ncbi:hypothetical protein L218DRAFT_922830 [Marasmius fiardii PR-910]|nr:hypothetical protein L218DRAFT_922830 [Marasmius fiardii PR-910]
MFSSTESGSPSYISSHSADVILSDIRPIKLKIDALISINVLLDEFLYNILKASRSLTTNKLRAGLLAVLPTTLGKEALLEAEVELRAYWDRTRRPKGPSSLEDDSDSFHLQWAFELLRLKCEAYSTLNESDEDPVAESRLLERMAGVSNQQPPKPSLVAPAALYLTAILEAMCEHILSNVGRVAARDSSRTTATIQDVFTALCEDDSIYGLFKTMNVYEQIEQQSQETRPRRSKSISHTDKLSISRTSSREGVVKGASPTPPSRVSSEGSSTMPPPSIPGPRTSFEKAKSLKKFGRSSGDRESSSVNGHKKSDSTLSENGKQNWGVHNQYEEVDISLQDFDDLMRSDATMKVSLTPDRLKTMEVYKQEKQEKDQRANRTKVPDSASLGTRTDGRRPSLRNVDSIQEDEEESHSKPTTTHNNRTRQTSVTSLSSKAKAAVLTRTRSTSVGGPSIEGVSRKSSKSELSSHPPPTMHTQNRSRAFASGRPQGFDADPFPPRTRKIQHNRESLDLDEVMAGSDGEDDDALTLSKAMSTPKRPSGQRARGGPPKVSASTRELMDFLNEGPPDTPKTTGLSKSGRDLMEFLDNGPPDHNYGLPPVVDSTKKGSGRLQRMISKLNMGNSEKSGTKNPQDEFSRRIPPSTPVSPTHRSGLSPQNSTPNLSMLANRPIPPRPPQPQMISPPSSPKQASVDLATPAPPPPPPPPPQRQTVSRKTPSYDLNAPVAPNSAAFANKPILPVAQENRNVTVPSDNLEPAKNHLKPVTPAKRSPARVTPPSIQTTTRRSAPDSSSATTPSSVITTGDLQELRRHISRATHPEECRLVMDAFLSKAGIPIEPVECDVPYPSPSNTEAAEAAADSKRSSADSVLEASLVELFLGGGATAVEPIPPRKKKYRPTRTVATPTHVKMNGHGNGVVPIVPEGIKV